MLSPSFNEIHNEYNTLKGFLILNNVGYPSPGMKLLTEICLSRVSKCTVLFQTRSNLSSPSSLGVFQGFVLYVPFSKYWNSLVLKIFIFNLLVLDSKPWLRLRLWLVLLFSLFFFFFGSSNILILYLFLLSKSTLLQLPSP